MGKPCKPVLGVKMSQRRK